MTLGAVRRWLCACVVIAIFVIAGVSTLSGCRLARPAAEAESNPGRPAGTISGRVRAPQGQVAIEGRLIEAIDVDTGERRRGVTGAGGGFTFKLKPGAYKIQLSLRPGESLAKEPGIIDLKRTGGDTQANFVLEAFPISRPSDPAKSSGSSLGPPIA